MQHYDWPTFLHDWNETLLTFARDTDDLDDLSEDEDSPTEQIFSGWLGYPGASEQQVYDLEQRLQTRLPPSYRSFLLASNGFRQPGNTVPRLYSIPQVDWYRNTDQATIDIWLQGFQESRKMYPNAPAPLEDAFEPDLPFTLQVSAEEQAGTAVYLLNPQKVSEDGEWEAWFFAHWVPGVNRYASFWELMKAERDSLVYILRRNRSEPTPHVDPSLGVEATDLTGLLAILAQGDEYQQKLAIDALGNLRDLRAFEPIAHILADPEADLFVREYAARSIGMLRDPRSAALLIEVYRRPMSANEITTNILKSAQPPFSDTAIPSMPLSEFLSQANRLFNINLNVTTVSNGLNDHLRYAIRQGLFELGTFATPTLEQARYDSNPQIRALAEEVLNYVAR
jgi:hypothetical protein